MYNGYTNYETWNVALWINNDEGLYNISRDCKDFDDFINQSGLKETPDGISLTDSQLNISELDEVIKENQRT